MYSFEDAKPNSEVRSSEAYGVIRFDLKADGYDREFVPIKIMCSVTGVVVCATNRFARTVL